METQLPIPLCSYWFTSLAAPVATIIAVFFSVKYENRRHRKELDTRMLQFEKQLIENFEQRKLEVGKALLNRQLDTLQGAYDRLSKFRRAYHPMLSEHDAESKAPGQISPLNPIQLLEFGQMLEWIDANLLYLPKELRDPYRSAFVQLYAVGRIGGRAPEMELEKLDDLYEKVSKELTRYVDDLSTKFGLIQ